MKIDMLFELAVIGFLIKTLPEFLSFEHPKVHFT